MNFAEIFKVFAIFYVILIFIITAVFGATLPDDAPGVEDIQGNIIGAALKRTAIIGGIAGAAGAAGAILLRDPRPIVLAAFLSLWTLFQSIFYDIMGIAMGHGATATTITTLLSVPFWISGIFGIYQVLGGGWRGHA